MTANRGLFVRNSGTTGTTPIEGRLVLASLVAENAPGVPRQGLLDQKTTNVVTGNSDWTYSVAPCLPVLNRATNEGVYMFTLTGTSSVASSAAPGTGSRWDLIYVKQNDPDKGDTGNTAVLGVQQGTAATSPTKPYAQLPAGAYVLAEAQVSAGATGMNHANVTITQVWRHTALRGAPIPVRNTAERDEITPVVFTAVRRLDLGGAAIQTYDGANWKLSGVPQFAEYVSTAPFNIAGGSVSWDVGPLTVDTGRSVNNTFSNTNGALSGAINFTETGYYSFVSTTIGQGSPGPAWASARLNGNEIISTFMTSGYAWEISTAGTVYVQSGSYLRWVTMFTNAVSNCNTRIRIVKNA